MTREEMAERLMENVQGFDSDFADDEAFGADDPVKRAGFSTLPVQLTIANGQQLANAAVGLDLFKVDDVDAAALPTGVASPAIALYKNIIKYLMANPSQLQSIVIQSNETSTGGAPVLGSLRISPKRVTPFGMNCANEVRIQSYQTTQDFQSNRVTIPLAVPLDSFTFLNLISDVNASGATVLLNLTLMIGRRVEGRKGLPRGAQGVTQRPGGRGPVIAGPSQLGRRPGR